MGKITEQLTDKIYKITLPTPYLVGPVNTYLIEDDALVLIDAGPKTTEALQVLEKGLKDHGYDTSDIEIVILTHHHPDHVGLLEVFLPHAKIYAHPKCEPWITKDEQFLDNARSFLRELYEKHGMPHHMIEKIELQNKKLLNASPKGRIDLYLQEGNDIDGLQNWTVLETPGHAQSHISLYRQKDGLLISGDHIIKHISSNAIIEAPYDEGEERPKTLLQYRESLHKCLHIHKAYSGHGDIVENPKELILKRLNDQERKAEEFKQLLGNDELTTFELCKRKYKHIYEEQPGLTFSETLGHLDLLEKNNEVKSVVKDGLIYYKANSNEK